MTSPQHPAAVWPHLLACAALAVWIDFGSHHRYQTADSIVPILVSLQKWTLFYWEQRRFGMLLPLLALPVRSPLANLLLQNALSIFAGLAAGMLLARYAVRGRAWPLVGWLGTTLMLWLSPDRFRGQLLGTAQPYGTALALAVTGLLLARGRTFRDQPAWIAAASVALLLAHWLSPATFVVVLGLVWLPRLDTIVRAPRHAWRDPELWLPSALALGSFAIVTIASRLHSHGHNHNTVLPPEGWPSGWLAVATRLPELTGPSAWVAVAGGLAMAGVLIAWLRPPLSAPVTPALRTALTLLGAGLLYWLFAGSLRWVVIQNGAAPRYLIPSLQLAQCAAAIAALSPWIDRERPMPARISMLAAVAALAAAIGSYGLPSLAGLRSDLEARLGGSSAEVLAAGCTHLAGDYWDVWPTVFAVHMKRHATGDDDVLWGVTYRSEPTGPELLAAATQRLRLCAERGADLHRALKLGLGPLVLAERRGTLDVYERPSDSASDLPGNPDRLRTLAPRHTPR